MKIFICNGFPGVGKTTFQTMCKAVYEGDTYILSTVDFVKYVASICGWDGKKTPEARKFLSDLKDLLTQWADVPWKKISTELKRISQSEVFEGIHEALVFVDVREPDEIERFREVYGAQTVLITRDGFTAETCSNHADRDVMNGNYDYVIDNFGTTEDLKNIADSFVKFIFSN